MTTTTMEKKRVGFPLAGWIVLAVLAAVGLASWGYEIARGMADVGLGQQVVWGLYIAGFFTAAGAGAGLLFFGGWSQYRELISKEERYKVLSLSLVSFILAGVLILMDLGGPLGAWRIAISGQWTSLMVWDFYLLIASGIVALIAWFMARGGSGNKILGLLGMVLAVGLVVVEAWMLASQAAHPFWGGGLIVISFLLSAAIGAVGLALFALDKERTAGLKNCLGYVVGGSLVLVAAEILTEALAGEPRAGEVVKLVVGGSVAPLFWLHVVMGIVIPLVLVWGKSVSRTQALIAGGLAIFGVLLEKTWVLAAGQAQPWLNLSVGSYTPTWVEIVGVVGMVALGAVLYLVALQLRPKEI
jgi:molybdopterin-containing oxidoreductase family membrane subunit